jgi:asparagine N-glycosylation enzyme membrane subunit Stt3
MITRVGYLVIIGTGILLFGHAWTVEPTLLIVKVILAFILIALIEIGFARKNTNRLTTQAVWSVIIFLIVVAIIGFGLSGWYPFK